MKNLFLLRHADAEPAESGNDIMRPISLRGRVEAELLGRYLVKSETIPDIILCSSALRAKQTGEVMLKAMHLDIELKIIDSLYLSPSDEYHQLVRQQNNNHSCILVIGHNPGILQAGSELISSELSYLPTCGLLKVQFRELSWNSCIEHGGQIEGFLHMGSLMA